MNPPEFPLDGIVLDLDDTLLDTTGLLLPAADRRAIASLVSADWPGTIADGLEALTARRAAGAGMDVFRRMANDAELPETAGVAAERAFFDYDVPPLELEPRVRTTLDALGALAPLVLMTFGMPHMQRRKVERLGIGDDFAETVIVELSGRATKTDHLGALLTRRSWSADRVVVVGDSLAGEIAAACAHGCAGIWIDGGGERAGDRVPDHVRPWRTVRHVAEVPALLANV